jgi:acetyltransferase-like isoleucine patch superfamily enzyme
LVGNLVIESGAKVVIDKNGILECGKNVRVKSHSFVRVTPGSHISLGTNVSIQRNTIVIGDITIGNNCLIAPNCYLSSFSHSLKGWPELTIKEADKIYGKSFPISISEDTWLCKDVCVCPGVTICSHVVVGAGSLVNSSYFVPYSLLVGSPAKLKKIYHSIA